MLLVFRLTELGIALLKGFISYSHLDREICEALYKALGPLNSKIRFWYDRSLNPGDRPEEQIAYHLRRSQLAIFVTTPNALRADGYVTKKEMPFAYALHQSKSLDVIIAATARPVAWGDCFLKETELCPAKGRTLADSWDGSDLETWSVDVAREVEALVEQPHVFKSQSRPPEIDAACNRIQARCELLSSLALNGEPGLSDEVQLQLVSLTNGVLATLRTNFADFRAEVSTLEPKLTESFSGLRLNGATSDAARALMAEFFLLKDGLRAHNFPLPPNFQEGELRSRRDFDREELEHHQEAFERSNVETRYVRQHGIEFTFAQTDEIEVKSEIGLSLLVGPFVNIEGVERIRKDMMAAATVLQQDADLAFEEVPPALNHSIERLTEATSLARDSDDTDVASPEPAKPRLSPSLEHAIKQALQEASQRKHEYSTLEHLLLALTFEPDAEEVLVACRVDLHKLRSDLTSYLDNDCGAFVVEQVGQVQVTAAFQTAVQRALLHVHSASRDQVTGANLLVSIMAHRDSHAAYFLQEQDMTRYDAVHYMSSNVRK